MKNRDTMTSHNRCAVIEIMGNNCPDLTIYGAIACDADEVFTIDHPLTDKEVLFKKMDDISWICDKCRTNS